MRFCLDLRYGVPPLTNGLLLLLALLQGKPWNQPLEALYDFHGNPPLLNFAFFSLLIFYLICLFVSVRLPVVITRLRPPVHAFSVLTFFLTVEPIQIRAGDHSAPLTLSLLASILFPPLFFWIALVFIALGSCFKSSCFWVYRFLHKIPTVLVTCCFRCHDDSLPSPPPSWELEMVEIQT